MSRSSQTDRKPVVALPETRQLDVLAGLLERRGAEVLRCPMVAILDAPEPAPVLAWIRRLIAEPMDLLIIFTGEGLYRLLGFAERDALTAKFVAALAQTRKLTRGPKPVRALKSIDLQAELEAAAPTTAGVIETLETLELTGKRVGVQLYGTDPNDTLMSYLRTRGITPDCVAPYVYASASEDRKVVELIERMGKGEIDAIAFTSKAQIERLRKIARQRELEQALDAALRATTVAAIGPVVAEQLGDAGVRVDVMPERSYFMKPLVSELARVLDLGPA